jgi:aspartokinase
MERAFLFIMRRSSLRTETISCDGQPTSLPIVPQETAFEKQRGVSMVETRDGFCQVHIDDLGLPLAQRRLEVLNAIATAKVGIDFLKMTPSGISFLVPESLSICVEETLQALGVHHSVRGDRSIVMVHAVNIRDEEGLIAGIVSRVIAVGGQIDHIGDGHDRLLLVLHREHAERISADLRQSWSDGKLGTIS